jgi:hypothetical protein
MGSREMTMTSEERETARKAKKQARNQQLLEDDWRNGEHAVKALKFFEVNPQAYKTFGMLAEKVIAREEFEHAAGALWEVMRWYLRYELPVRYEFKCPNNFRAYAARLWLEEHPQYPIFFKLCALRSQGKGGSRDEYGRSSEDMFYA